MVSRVYVVSFASGIEFSLSRFRLHKQIVNAGLTPIFYSPRIIKAKDPIFFEEMFLTKSRHPKGYGGWVWKPYIVFDALRQIPEGAILIYMDIGCDLLPTSRFHMVLESFKKSENDILILPVSNRTGGVRARGASEFLWTTKSVLDYFSLNSEARLMPQFRATWFALKVNSRSLSLAEYWFRCATLENNQLLIPNVANVGDSSCHQFDQSLLSCILKKSIVEQRISTCMLLSEELGSSIWSTRNLSLFAASSTSGWTKLLQRVMMKLRNYRLKFSERHS